ncbi:hypothetical protein [Shewanella algae]|uniref:hypothetical protein n=1 Tax=Shewanella algae TaxID=38313 RepID=UPI00305DA27F|nr:hypothetical protein [Shewanella algae]
MDYFYNFLIEFGFIIKTNLAPLLTVFGWYILLVNTDRIALRNESRTSVDFCIKKIDDLMITTSEFHHKTKKDKLTKYQFEITASSIISAIETKQSYLRKRTNHTFIPDSKLSLLRTLLVPTLNKTTYEQSIDELMDTVELLEEQYANRFGEKWYKNLKLGSKATISITVIILFSSLIAA